ncbi:hypothetical protein BDF20DRAFT_917691 [Mycotypha africana]|uniref:uncharacterized protein n=1 Tax=Mycotypha africana TaxID=64632 RepID=UPI002300A83E|nr:uncharacterized protein BDF20DRAFT_917691 [Mycotypha africana]KAI8967218.1 hypothetical protein BDF20DRAFT_917691 [Mycotypha africana]
MSASTNNSVTSSTPAVTQKQLNSHMDNLDITMQQDDMKNLLPVRNLHPPPLSVSQALPLIFKQELDAMKAETNETAEYIQYLEGLQSVTSTGLDIDQHWARLIPIRIMNRDQRSWFELSLKGRVRALLPTLRKEVARTVLNFLRNAQDIVGKVVAKARLVASSDICVVFEARWQYYMRKLLKTSNEM